ncbi:MAG TPA: hypothetical protein VFJ24_11230 [Gaiellales bacterium]|nr:hypothetical protein [Gaiellales bacterium]
MLLPVLLVFGASLAGMVWRVGEWRPSQSTDAWSYGAWGQQLARFEAPLYDHALTTPKPLAIALAALASPLPPQRAFQAVVVVFLAVLTAALFWAAFRGGGTAGAFVAMVALGTSAVLGHSLQGGLVDGIAAALVMVALVTRGRARYSALFVAGLARPEAWLLCGVAVFADAAGPLRRRIALAALAAAAAPTAWAVFDFAVAGDPLATAHRTDAIIALAYRGWSTPSPSSFVSGIVRNVGLIVVVAGCAGLVIQAVRGRRAESDILPLAVIVVWTATVVVETRRVPFEARFLFATAMPLLVGSAITAGALVPPRLWGSAHLAAIASAAAFLLTVATIPAPRGGSATPILQAVPAIHKVVACGPMLVTSQGRRGQRHRTVAILPKLAGLSQRSLADFTTVHTRNIAGVYAIRGHGPPGWNSQRYAFGTISISPTCHTRLTGS